MNCFATQTSETELGDLFTASNGPKDAGVKSSNRNINRETPMIDPLHWTLEQCVNFIADTFGGSILYAAMLAISFDDVEGWRNEVRRRVS